jgi:ABC-type transport system involved in multi-copper enzyme maturation permease subunit
LWLIDAMPANNAMNGLLSISDFPEKWSAIVVRELRRGLRQPFFIWPFVCIHFLCLAALGVEWQAIHGSRGSFFGEGAAVYAFWTSVFFVMGLIMPWRCFDSLREEFSHGNKELLLMAGLSRWAIVWGKCKVQCVLALLTLASLFPYILVRYFFGAFDLLDNVLSCALLCSYVLAAGSVMVASSGFDSIRSRMLVIGLGQFYVSGTAFAGLLLINASTAASSFFVINLVVVELLFAVMMMQIGRGTLKLFRLPWEPPPARAMLVAFALSPILILLVTILLCGFGTIPGSLLVLVLTLRHDPDLAAPGIHKKRILR